MEEFHYNATLASRDVVDTYSHYEMLVTFDIMSVYKVAVDMSPPHRKITKLLLTQPPLLLEKS
jgi:hypothetical protein